jgi:hypothetical protein
MEGRGVFWLHATLTGFLFRPVLRLRRRVAAEAEALGLSAGRPYIGLQVQSPPHMHSLT